MPLKDKVIGLSYAVRQLVYRVSSYGYIKMVFKSFSKAFERKAKAVMASSSHLT